MPRVKSDYVETDCVVKFTTTNAYMVLVSMPGDRPDREVFLPKAHVRVDEAGTVHVEEWLAMKEELI